jgi:nitrogen fixation NifU-like protein
MYSAKVLDHFQNPRNAGEITNPTVRVRLENPACGDILELTAKVDGEIFSEVRFRAKGCVPAMACASLLTEMIVGKKTKDFKVSKEELVSRIGGLPPASGHAAQLSIDALHALLEEVDRGK